MSIESISPKQNDIEFPSGVWFFQKITQPLVRIFSGSMTHELPTLENNNYVVEKLILKKEFFAQHAPQTLQADGRYFQLNRSRGQDAMKSFIYYPLTGESAVLSIVTQGKRGTTSATLRRISDNQTAE